MTAMTPRAQSIPTMKIRDPKEKERVPRATMEMTMAKARGARKLSLTTTTATMTTTRIRDQRVAMEKERDTRATEMMARARQTRRDTEMLGTTNLRSTESKQNI